MEKLLFCVKCKSLLTKTKPLTTDLLTAQKVLINHLKLTSEKDTMLLFNQWECKCGSNIITAGI